MLTVTEPSRYGQGRCTVCGRIIGGRRWGIPGLASPKVELAGHTNKATGRRCNGGGKIVPMLILVEARDLRELLRGELIAIPRSPAITALLDALKAAGA
jgi:hypothetical protein